MHMKRKLILAASLSGPLLCPLAHGVEANVAGGANAPPAVPTAAAPGRPGLPGAVSRTIEILMTGNARFTPDRLDVQQGQTVKLHLRNTSKVPHEFALISPEEFNAHPDAMRTLPHMPHSGAGTARLLPGQTVDIIWQFFAPGTVYYACLIPYHWKSGMHGTITVTPAASPP